METAEAWLILSAPHASFGFPPECLSCGTPTSRSRKSTTLRNMPVTTLETLTNGTVFKGSFHASKLSHVLLLFQWYPFSESSPESYLCSNVGTSPRLRRSALSQEKLPHIRLGPYVIDFR